MLANLIFLDRLLEIGASRSRARICEDKKNYSKNATYDQNEKYRSIEKSGPGLYSRFNSPSVIFMHRHLLVIAQPARWAPVPNLIRNHLTVNSISPSVGPAPVAG
jgi:hypothetical protein